jgi:hypothetical protein
MKRTFCHNRKARDESESTIGVAVGNRRHRISQPVTHGAGAKPGRILAVCDWE